MKHINWSGFNPGVWQDEINVRDFIQTNYKAYEGDANFLAGATPRTKALMKKIQSRTSSPFPSYNRGMLSVDTAPHQGGSHRY